MIASLIGSAVLVLLGLLLLLIGGGVPGASIFTYLSLGSFGFLAIFVICFTACMLELSG